MSAKSKSIANLICQILFVIAEVVGILVYPKLRWSILLWYTNLSNWLAAGVSIACIVFFVLKKGQPKALRVLRLMAAVQLTLTFLTVYLFLAPLSEMEEPGGFYEITFHRHLLVLHTICPLLYVVSWLFFEASDYEIKDTVFAIGFTLLYEIVFAILNLAKVVHGPYPFLYVYEQPWWLSMIYLASFPGLAYLISLGLYALKTKVPLFHGGEGQRAQ